MHSFALASEGLAFNKDGTLLGSNSRGVGGEGGLRNAPTQTKLCDSHSFSSCDNSGSIKPHDNNNNNRNRQRWRNCMTYVR